MKTVLLLDVDGVVNVDLDPGWPGGLSRADAPAGGRVHELRWSPVLVDRIRDLHTSGAVEVRWCTTWSPHADVLEALWDLPPLGRCFTDPVPHRSKRILKYAAALAVVDGGDRLIWIDDREIPRFGPARAALLASGRALLIEPVPTYGLAPHHLDLIDLFLNGDNP